MFQYAFAYATAKKLKCSFRIDSTSHGTKLLCYFKLRKLERYYYHFSAIKKRYLELKQTGHQDPLDVLKKIQDRTYYNGYFQSEIYFEAFVSQIRKMFTVKSAWKAIFDHEFGELYKNNQILCIHIRRTDYISHGNEAVGGSDITLPLAYYDKCLHHKDYSNYKKIVLSDDMAFAKEHFSHLPNVMITHNEEIIDFQLIMNADVVITANSSFSWWAAWLNPKKQKQVYAPQYWFGHKTQCEYPVGIIPQNWIKIDF